MAGHHDHNYGTATLGHHGRFTIGSRQWGGDQVLTELVRQQSLVGIIAATSSEEHRDLGLWGPSFVGLLERVRRGVVKLTAYAEGTRGLFI